jgi:hypothetical protein
VYGHVLSLRPLEPHNDMLDCRFRIEGGLLAPNVARPCAMGFCSSGIYAVIRLQSISLAEIHIENEEK